MDFENHLYNWSGIYISEMLQESLKIVTHFFGQHVCANFGEITLPSIYKNNVVVFN